MFCWTLPPVGLITNPKATPFAIDCQQWLESLLDRGYHVILPEIIDYEVRRELLRVNKIKSIRRLDDLKSALIYLPITTAVMLKAAQMWAQVRQQCKPTADDRVLDYLLQLPRSCLCFGLFGRLFIVARIWGGGL